MPERSVFIEQSLEIRKFTLAYLILLCKFSVNIVFHECIDAFLTHLLKHMEQIMCPHHMCCRTRVEHVIRKLKFDEGPSDSAHRSNYRRPYGEDVRNLGFRLIAY